MWRAAGSPRAFFEGLEPQPPRTLAGARAAALGTVGLTLACAFGFLRATGSDAYLPVLASALLLGLLFWAYTWGFGSIFVQRPGLETRTWEVSGWSFAPGLFAGLSMLPALLAFPGPALVLTLLGALLWHLHVLRVGVSVFLGRPAWRVVTLYAAFIYLFPAGVFWGLVWFFAQGPV